HVRDAWEARRRSVSKVRNRVLWGSSLTLAVGGAFVGNPVAGVLSGIGLASAQNLWQDQLNSLTAKWLSPESYHIWDVDRRIGRPR
ncbi:MAG TPA: hypothetical protein VD858_18545, partial [Reyranella sp.]|nr:hypothetical protein [Reyranella sp.]